MNIKKWGSLLCGTVLMVSLTGCGQFFSPAMVIDGTEISGGLYLLEQYNAYDEARSKVEDNTKDILTQKIDDTTAKKWIHDETVKTSKEYVAVEKLSEENDVTLSEEDVTSLESALSTWDTGGSYEAYAQNGIGKDTFYDYIANQTLKNNLFTKLYKEEGDSFVSDEELKKLYNEKYISLDTITIPLTQEDASTRVDDAVKTQIEEGTQQLVNELQAGTKSPDNLQADIEALYALSGTVYTESVATFSNSEVAIHPDEDDTTNSYSEEFLEQVAQEPFGTYGMTVVDDEDGGVYDVILYRKIEPLTDEEDFTTRRDTLLQDVKEDDFNELLDTTADGYTIKQRALSEWYYNPKNIVYFSRGNSTTTTTTQ